MPRHERRAEAGREGRLRPGQAALGAGHLGGVAREEVVHRLGAGQLRDRRHHPEGVAGEHHDVLRMPGAARGAGVRDEVQRVGAAGVLGERRVVEVRHAGDRIDDHVLHHRAEALGGGVDLRLGVAREADGLGVAAALEVEDPGIRPAVLVIAEQLAGAVVRQRRLAGARQAEEDRRAALGVQRRVGRAMHRHHALAGQDVVQVGEDRLLHLARVGRAADQHELLREVDGDHGLRSATVPGGIRLEARQVDDRHVRHVGRDLGAVRPDEQVADEQRVPRELGEHPRLDPVGRIGAAVEVLGEQLPALGMLQEVLAQGLELLGRDRAVVVPPDLVLGAGVADHELVLGRAAGMAAGGGDDRAAAGELRLLAGQRLLVEARRLEIPVDGLEIAEAGRLGTVGRVVITDVGQERISRAPVRLSTRLSRTAPPSGSDRETSARSYRSAARRISVPRLLAVPATSRRRSFAVIMGSSRGPQCGQTG